MESVLELKGKLQNVYAQYSTYIDKEMCIRDSIYHGECHSGIE